MTLQEMQACAVETLDYFLKVMPDVPFTAEDIVIDFAPKSKMVKRYKELAAKYKPDMQLNASREHDLTNNVAGIALIGRDKCAALMRENSRNTKKHFRHDVFHELTHIFCGKLENSEGYINVYGDGTTGIDNPVNVIYDGMLNAGYSVWSEFIAEYYTVKYTERKYLLADMTRHIQSLISEVDLLNQMNAKSPFAYACARFLNAMDAAEEFSSLSEEHSDSGVGAAFYSCLDILFKQIKKEKPWEITENFIDELGNKYMMFFSVNVIAQMNGGGY